jgi:hypothetical protein
MVKKWIEFLFWLYTKVCLNIKTIDSISIQHSLTIAQHCFNVKKQ